MENPQHSQHDTTSGQRRFETGTVWTTLAFFLWLLVHESRENFHRTLQQGIVADEINFLSDDVHTAIHRGNNPECDDEILHSYNALDALKGTRDSMWKVYQKHASCFERTDAESQRLELTRRNINQTIESGIRDFEQKLHIGSATEVKRPRPISLAQIPANTGSSDTPHCEEIPPLPRVSETAMSASVKNVQ